VCHYCTIQRPFAASYRQVWLHAVSSVPRCDTPTRSCSVLAQKSSEIILESSGSLVADEREAADVKHACSAELGGR
jgi:hypothetical protein